MFIHIKNLVSDNQIKFNTLVSSQTNENYVSAFYFVPDLMSDSKYSPELKSDINEILDLAKQLLEKHNYQIDDSDYYIEFWSYKLKGNEGKIPMPLIRHKDDDAAVLFKVETCIFYTEKSDTIEGGNLMIFDNDNNLSHTLKISTGDVVLLGGDIIHQVEQISGKGTRNCIVVQYKSIRNKL